MNCRTCDRHIAPDEKRHGRKCMDCKRAYDRSMARHYYRKEYHREYMRERRARDPEFAERCKGHLARYRKTEKFAAVNRRLARARRAVAHQALTDDVVVEAVGPCAYCGAPSAAVDHVFPLSKYQDDRACNKVPVCKSCNSAKRDRHPLAWLLRLASQELTHGCPTDQA